MKMRPDQAKLMQMAELLASVDIDQLTGPIAEVRKIGQAMGLAQAALNARQPSNSDDGIEVWASGPSDGVEDRLFSRGPAPSLAALGAVPEGDVVMGMSAGGTELARGLVKSDQTIDWNYRLDAQRQAAADLLFETFEADDILDDEAAIVESSGWRHRSPGDEWTKPVFVDCGVDGMESVQMDFVVRFAPNSDEIILAEFDGDNILPTPDDSPQP